MGSNAKRGGVGMGRTHLDEGGREWGVGMRIESPPNLRNQPLSRIGQSEGTRLAGTGENAAGCAWGRSNVQRVVF